MTLFQRLFKKEPEPPTPKEVHLFIEELTENLLEMTDFMRTKECSSRTDKDIYDNSVFKLLNRRHSTFRDIWYFFGGTIDAFQHGFEKVDGIPMEEAISIWPAKCTEILVLAGMDPDEAAKLSPNFVPL